MKYEVWNPKYEICNLKDGIWNRKSEIRNLKPDIWILKSGIWILNLWYKIGNLNIWNLETGNIKPAIRNPTPEFLAVHLNSKPENKTRHPNMEYNTCYLILKSKPDIKHLKYKFWNLNPDIKPRNRILKNLKYET